MILKLKDFNFMEVCEFYSMHEFETNFFQITNTF